MGVTIKIKGSTETNEYKDAIALKEIFEKRFRNNTINGEILIISNATLFGQTVKDVDLIALGSFKKFRLDIKTKARTNKNINLDKSEQKKLLEQMRPVFVNDFCFVFETKRHRANDIQLNGISLLVKYGKKLSDVTTQSENQKYSLKEFFSDRLNFSPYINNFIWLRNVNWNSIKDLLGNNTKIYNKHNYLPNTFSVDFLFQLACVQTSPYIPYDYNNKSLKGYSAFSSLKKGIEYNINELNSIFDIFERVKKGQGELTRKKIEFITKKLLKEQKYAQNIGDKFTIISGRAGTGKTIKLLNIACDLAIDTGSRCLILTYNHALVSDIKRTLALADIPDGIDSYTVNIATLHKFFYEIVIGLEISDEIKETKNGKKYISNFINDYNKYLEQIKEYIELELIGNKEISELMKTRHQQVGWDFLLIDEAQDWSDLEKDIVFAIFKKENIIIADGVDQLIRTQAKCNWTRALKPNLHFNKTHEKKGLRQKISLVNFVNNLAIELNINWKLQAKKELLGGKIIISTSGYSNELHNREFNLCKSNGNSAYEMMFLVPPSLVEHTEQKNEYEKLAKVNCFLKTKEFENMGISIWDGTSTDLRTEYAVDINQHRLLQYESCRGLEGWTVVCLDFDDFIEYKMKTYTEIENNELALESFDEKRNRFVYLWSLIPLTRAIDTLIITLKHKDSFIAKVLKKVYNENPDYIEWID